MDMNNKSILTSFSRLCSLLFLIAILFIKSAESKPQIWISGDRPIYVYGIPIYPKQRNENAVILVKAPQQPIDDSSPIQFYPPDSESISFEEKINHSNDDKIRNFASIDLPNDSKTDNTNANSLSTISTDSTLNTSISRELTTIGSTSIAKTTETLGLVTSELISIERTSISDVVPNESTSKLDKLVSIESTYTEIPNKTSISTNSTKAVTFGQLFTTEAVSELFSKSNEEESTSEEDSSAVEFESKNLKSSLTSSTENSEEDISSETTTDADDSSPTEESGDEEQTTIKVSNKKRSKF